MQSHLGLEVGWFNLTCDITMMLGSLVCFCCFSLSCLWLKKMLVIIQPFYASMLSWKLETKSKN